MGIKKEGIRPIKSFLFFQDFLNPIPALLNKITIALNSYFDISLIIIKISFRKSSNTLVELSLKVTTPF